MMSNKIFQSCCKYTKILMPKAQNLTLNNSKTISLNCHFIDQIKKLYLETIRLNSTEKCDEIQNLIFRFDMTLKRLRNPNTTTISEIIPINELMSNVKTLTSINNNSLIAPYQFNENFTINFFNKTKMTIFKDIDSVLISFKIPTYEEVNLLHIFPKPFLHNNKPFIYNLGHAYFAKTPKLIIFTNNTYKRNCFYSVSIRKTFCKNALTMRQCDHDVIINNNIDSFSKCFTKLPFNNFIMKNMFDFYFSIHSPLNVNITCFNKTEKLHFTKSTNILHAHNCSLQVEKFKILANDSDQYKIFVLPTGQNNITYTIFRFFCIFMLFFFLIPNLVFVSAVYVYSYFIIPESNDNSTYLAFASTILETNTSTMKNYKETLV